MYGLARLKTVAGLRAQILATRKTGELREIIIRGRFTYEELTKLYMELPERKCRRWVRLRKKRLEEPTNERQLSML